MVAKPDHKPYAEGPAKLAFGLNTEGRLVHVRDAARGKACACVCPAPDCGRPLVARRAQTWHFAHQPGADCVRAYESMLHRLAKEVLEETLYLELPPVRVEDGGRVVQTHARRQMRFETARLEVRLGDVIPDIIVARQGHELIVEILVTHACDALKIAKLREGGVAAIEIDLSDLPRGADRETVRLAVTKTAPRTWLFNKKLDDAQALLADKLAEVEAERLRKVGKTADRLAEHWDRLTATPFRPATADEQAHLVHLGELGFRDLIGLNIQGQQGFTVGPAIWQAKVVQALIISPPEYIYYGPRKGMALRTLINNLFDEGLIHPLFELERERELLGLVRQRHDDFATPQAVLDTYLRLLAKRGQVTTDGEGLWLASDAARRDVRDRRTELEDQRERVEELGDALDAILTRAGPDTTDFDRGAWLVADLPDFGQSPTAIAEEGCEPWEALQEAMRKIRQAFDRHTDALDTLGLPVMPAIEAAAAARAEAAEARRLKAEQDQRDAEARDLELANAREARARAKGRPLPDLETFLATPIHPDRPISRLDLLRASDTGFYQVQFDIEDRLEEQRQAARRLEVAEQEVETLRRLAVSTNDEDWAAVFLNSSRPELGGRRPIEVCVDAESRRRCEKLIRPRHRLRRR